MKKENKPPPFNIKEIEKEYRKILQTDKIKAKELEKKLDFFNYGIE